MALPPFPRLAAAAAALLVAGCESAPSWPAPKNTTDIVLTEGRRTVTTSVGLGDALHLILPAPQRAGTQWETLAHDTKKLRTVSDLKPAAASPGAVEATFQAIHTAARTTLQFAAVDAKASSSDPDEFYTVEVSIDTTR